MAHRLCFSKMSVEQIERQLLDEEKNGKFRVLGKVASQRIRKYYKKRLTLQVDGSDKNIYLKSTGERFANGYDRIVIGDHGAYVEISEKQINKKVIKVKKGQEWRTNNLFCKYLWFESTKGDKVYLQKATVKYADYKIGFYYIDPRFLSL